MKNYITLLVLGLIAFTGSARGDRVVDTFSAGLPSKEVRESFSAPTATHYVAFKSHAALDPKLTMGGARSASINIKKGKSIAGEFDVRAGIYRVRYAKGSGGWVFLSYSGRRGEARKLGADLSGEGSIGVKLKSAPAEGKLTVTLHSAGKFQQESVAVTGAKEYRFALSKYEGVDLSKIDSISVELHVVEAKEALKFEFSSIMVYSKK
ncbi:MAG: hypothetical protein ACSHYF_04100 [Verrucomicrobiaceae bacterium]